jgi:type I restriction enzyme, S subunit
MTDLPEGWERVSLSEVCTKIVDGSHNPPPKQAEGLPMLSAVNVDNNQIHFSQYRLISKEAWNSENRRTDVQPHDVLLTIVGAIGRAATVPEGIRPFTLQRSVAVLKPWGIVPRFLMYQLEESQVARFFEENARGTAQKGVYLKTLSTTPINLPPLPEQHRIVAKIEALFSELDAGQDSLTRAQAQLKLYRQSLLKAAFQGRLTADWRKANADKLEDPETLLTRIRTEREARYKQALDDWQTALTDWRAGGEVGRKPAKPKRPADVRLIDDVAGLPTLPRGWFYVARECHELCVSGLAHAGFRYGHALKRTSNMIAN